MAKPQVALIAVRDRDCRWSITSSLRRLGWTVIEHASGFHVVQALAEVIIGDGLGPNPDLIVVDAISAGCSGLTIAAGFRDLGVTIPIILIAPGVPYDETSDTYAGSVIVDPATAAVTLVAIAKLVPMQRASVFDAAATEDRKRHVR